jgi:hypothetical protein
VAIDDEEADRRMAGGFDYEAESTHFPVTNMWDESGMSASA